MTHFESVTAWVKSHLFLHSQFCQFLFFVLYALELFTRKPSIFDFGVLDIGWAYLVRGREQTLKATVYVGALRNTLLLVLLAFGQKGMLASWSLVYTISFVYFYLLSITPPLEMIPMETQACEVATLRYGTECVICLDDLEQDAQICILDCEHAFHPGCLNQWFENRQICPLCMV
jgi:hypothetical protein